MSKSMKEAYNILWWKDVFEAWKTRILPAVYVVEAIALVSLFVRVPTWIFTVVMTSLILLMLAFYICHYAAKVCDRRIEKRGYTEVGLEMWGLA